MLSRYITKLAIDIEKCGFSEKQLEPAVVQRSAGWD